MSEIYFKMDEIFPNAIHRILLYADDVILITPTKTDGQILKKVDQRELVHIGLSLNESKEIVKQFDINGQDSTTIEWLGIKIAGNLTCRDETNNRIAEATQASKKVKRISRERNILLSPKLKIVILQSLVAIHLITGLDVINFAEDQKCDLLNSMLQSILDYTNLTMDKAEKMDSAIMGNVLINDDELTALDINDDSSDPFNTISTHDDRSPDTTALNLPQIPPQSSCDQRTTKNRLHHQNLQRRNIPPTEREIERRKQLVARLQEEHTWCKICVPPIKFNIVVYRNVHRKQKHGLESEGPLMVFCDMCQHSISSIAFWKHICVDQMEEPDKEKLLIPCQHCDKSFSKFGIKNHSVKCAAKKKP